MQCPGRGRFAAVARPVPSGVGADPFVMRPVVLLVEDHPDTRQLYAIALDASGFHVLEAEHGEEALATIRQRLPDIVVTDLAMPVMDGLEFCRRVREIPAAARLPILAVTGQDTPSALEVVSRAGFCGVCTKPCPPDALVAFIQASLDCRPRCQGCWQGIRPLKRVRMRGGANWFRHSLDEEATGGGAE